MITLIEALGFRCLEYVRQPLGRFHVLVGPNGSGKSAFLDTLFFLGDLLTDGLDAAVEERSGNFQDLVWQRKEGRFEIAIEARIPEERRERLSNPEFDTVRYEVAVGLDAEGGVCLLNEKAVLRGPAAAPENPQRGLFPMAAEAPATIVSPRGSRGARTVLNKNVDGHDNYYDETGKGWDHSFKLGPRRAALASLPGDESKFPACTWLKDCLMEGVRPLSLNARVLGRASGPGQGGAFRRDGSNLPWHVARLEKSAPARFDAWVQNLRSALPGVLSVRVEERPGDRHRYLMIAQEGGIETPGWVCSAGVLRYMALTLPAFLPDFRGVCLVEEPENGLHPKAIETAYRTLSSAAHAQVLMATHSPVILGVARTGDVLCFAKTPAGATDIISGNEHPALKDWQGEVDLSALFAEGVLG